MPNAEVVAVNASETFAPVNPKLDGVRTGADGKFSIPAVGSGTYRFVAHHSEHPPSSTEPIDLDGQTSLSDVVIVMEMGGVIAGRAVSTTGEAVAWASIQVGPDPKGGGDRSSRRTAIADEDGSFLIKGVARTELVAMASSEAAASELVAVDLDIVAVVLLH